MSAEELLAGRYRYVRELGRGASGRVIEVRDESAGGAGCAIKSVPPADFARLKTEHEALARLAHPHLVGALELLRIERALPPPFGFPAGTALLVEALAPGRPSDRAFDGMGGDERTRAALRAAHGVALALGALHAEGLVHGDVKPANVLVDDEGQARLVDLGLVGPGVTGGVVRGTPRFLAPEAWTGVRSVGTDLYALGVTLHLWLGGEPPTSGAVPRPRPGGPAPEIVAALAAAEPRDRPLSARDAATRIAEAARRVGLDLPRVALAATPRERALAATARPYVEPIPALVDTLAEALDAGGVVRLAGSPGSGRTRLVREAVLRVQADRAERGSPVPTYWRVRPSAEPPTGPAILHLEHDAEHAERLDLEARVLGVPRTVVLEVGPAEPADVSVPPLDERGTEELLSSLFESAPSAATLRAVREATAGLAGRVVRSVVEAWSDGEDPTHAETHRARDTAGWGSALGPEAHVAAMRLALVGGEAPIEALEEVAAGTARLLAHGDAVVNEAGRVTLRSDHRRDLAAAGTARRRAALAQALQPFDSVSAAYLAAHRGEDASGAFAALARDALDRGRLDAAIRWLEDAFALLGPDDALQALAFEAHLAAARYDRAVAHAPSAAQAAEALRRAGRNEEAKARLARSDGAPVTRAWLALATGDVEGAKEAVREEVGAHEVRAWIALASGDEEGAENLVRRGLREEGEPRSLARLWSTLGSVLHLRGDGAGAVDAHQRCLAEAVALGERHLEATALGNLGAVRLELGQLGSALTALTEGARRLAALGRERDVVRALANMASAGLVLGDLAASEGWLDEAESLLSPSEGGDASVAAHIAGLRAEVAMRRGDLRAAREAAEVASADPRWEPRLVALMARHDRRWAERWRGATGTFDEAHATARVALAREDLAAAANALAQATPRHWTERLEHAFARLDLAEASHDQSAARAAGADARALIDRAALTLDPERRARFRATPRYDRVATAPALSESSRDDRPWRRLGALAKRLGRERDPAALRRIVVESALSLVDAERALLVARDERGVLRVLASAGVGADDAPSRSVVGRALAERAPVVSMDALSDEHLDEAASVHAMALRSVLCVPLRDRTEVLYMDDRMRTGVFGDDDRRLVRDLSDLAAIAFEGAEHLAQEREARARLAAAQRLLQTRLEDRERELEALRPMDDDAIVAVSPGMARAVETALKVADADVPVLLLGESGTGKELLARMLHRRSSRSAGPFVSESCGALPDALVESLLFGHVRGAFTGAGEAREGLFRAADGGTLFLDEVGEMSAAMQAKILRVLQEGEVRPVGATQTHPVNVRLVTATHRPLAAWIEDGRFRQDLYYRIAVVRIEVPPLRERPADIPELARRFLRRHGETSDRLSPAALEALSAHPWPGNARELENEIRRALVLAEGTIEPAHLSPSLREEAADPLDLKSQIAALETRLIREALARTEGNRTQAAAILGVSRYGLQKMLKRLAID